MQRSEHRQEAGETVLSVPAMTCRRCVRLISAHLGDVAGVVAVEADLTSRTVRVVGTPELDALDAAVAEAGFEVAHNPTNERPGGLP
jgi:copper chaperone CopZ